MTDTQANISNFLIAGLKVSRSRRTGSLQGVLCGLAMITAAAALGQQSDQSVALPTIAKNAGNIAADGTIDLGILPQLVGRRWENGQAGKATITVGKDGRYKIQLWVDKHCVNPGIASAPSTKSSLVGPFCWGPVSRLARMALF